MVLSYKLFLSESKNTLVADVNEIYLGFILNGNKWFDKEAEKQYNQRIEQITDEQRQEAIGQAEAMSIEFIKWAKDNGYSGTVKKVFWTARPGSMSAAVGQPVDQKKNPADLLIQFTDGPGNGFLGLSAKATKKKSGKVGFKNPGIGTLDRSLSLNLASYVKTETDKFVEEYDLPTSANKRKAFLRSDPNMLSIANQKGSELLSKLRDMLFDKLMTKKSSELKDHILSEWMDANVLYPPYIKVTGKGNKPPFIAVVENPVSNPKLQAMSTGDISLMKIGNESIGVMAGDKKILKMRFKYESQKMATSVKLSGDDW